MTMLPAEQGWLYFAHALVSAFMMLPMAVFLCRLYKAKIHSVLICIIYSVVVFLTSLLAMTTLAADPVVNFIRAMASMTFFALFFALVFKGKWWKTVAVYLVFYVVSGAVDVVIGLSVEYLTGLRFGAGSEMTTQKLMVSLFAAPFYWLGSYATYVVMQVKSLNFMRRRTILYCILSFVQIEVIALCTGRSKQTDVTIMMVCMVIILISQFVMFHSLYLAALSAKLSEEKAQRDKALTEERSYYHNLYEAHKEVRRIKHDMRNELAVVAQLIESPDTYDSGIVLFREIESRLNAADTTMFCEIPMIDALLHYKAHLSEERRVTFTATLSKGVASAENNSETVCGIGMYDLCSALGNILDNAIKAAATAEHGYVSLKMFIDMGYLFISCENNSGSSESMAKQAGSGLGKGILGELAEKYDGIYNLTEKSGIYTAVLSLRSEQ